MLFCWSPVITYAAVTFTAKPSVFNRDLLTTAHEPDVWKHLLVASVSGLGTGLWNPELGTTDSSGTTAPAKVEVTSEFGDTLVSGDGIATIVKNINWSRKNAADILGQSAADAGAVPLVVEWQDAVDPDHFRLGVNTIKIYSECGPTYTTTLTVVQNELHSRQTWTTGSTTGLVIAHMPNLTQALLNDIITDVSVFNADGQKVLTDCTTTGLLEVDDETGAVSIRHERMSSLSTGEYTIYFKLPNGSSSTVDHRLTFTVAEKTEQPPQEDTSSPDKPKNPPTGDVLTRSALTTLAAMLVMVLGVMLRLVTSKKKFEI